MVWCNVGVMWNGAPRCGGVIYVNYGAMWNVVWCQCMWNVECCNFRHGVIEMQNVWSGTWRGVECGVRVCGMLHNAKCKVTMWCEMWCCGIDEECGICNVLCDVRCGKWCNIPDVVARCKIKMWWFNEMWNILWCEIYCDVECGCGVEYLWMWNGVRCGLCDVEHVLWDVVVRNGAKADYSVMWSQM